MGTCYSRKASGGNNSYTTVQMASTKLEETSRLVRPSPYARTVNVNVDYIAKNNISHSNKYQNVPISNEQSDARNLSSKTVFQSSIPRFSSNLLPATASNAPSQKIRNSNYNENVLLHVANNNVDSASNTVTNIANNSAKSVTPEFQIKPKVLGSKSCPDKIVMSEKIQDKTVSVPTTHLGLTRQFFGKSAGSLCYVHSEEMAISENQHNGKLMFEQKKLNPEINFKADPHAKFYSHDSLSDFDSGLGNSMTEKNKAEDSDTIRDIEQLDLEESFGNPVDLYSTKACSSSTPKCFQKNSIPVKTSMYKKEPNGKWSFNEKCLVSNSENAAQKTYLNSVNTDETRIDPLYTINASENFGTTYASYKGLLSYQKSFKATDKIDKVNSSEKLSKTGQLNTSYIPKIKKNSSQCFNDTNNYLDRKQSNIKCQEPFQKIMQDSATDSVSQNIYHIDKSHIHENLVFSPTSDVENREFLIDDEISDQPGLMFNSLESESSEVKSLQEVVGELHALQLSNSLNENSSIRENIEGHSNKKDHTEARGSLFFGSDLGSSCSSIASDDLMLDYEKALDNFPEGTINEGPASPFRKFSDSDSISDKVAPLRSLIKHDFDEKNRYMCHVPVLNNHKAEFRLRSTSLPLRPPRPLSLSESDDGSIKLDSSSYRLLCQDINGLKTLLLRLKSVVQEAETINPFDQATPKNLFYHSLAQSDFPSNLEQSQEQNHSGSVQTVVQENADLKRQLILLQQQMEEKEHTIQLLQQQMIKYLNLHGPTDVKTLSVNAATQTEKTKPLMDSLCLSSSSTDGSSETLISMPENSEVFTEMAFGEQES